MLIAGEAVTEGAAGTIDLIDPSTGAVPRDEMLDSLDRLAPLLDRLAT
jgi:hypothetical protein